MADTVTIEQQVQQFCERYHQNNLKYLKFALMFVRSKEVVEDIVNDSFMNLWENRNDLAEVTNLESYFYTIIRNNCLNWIRNKQTQLKIQQSIHDTNYRLLLHDLNTLDEYDPNLIFTDEIHSILQKQLDKMPKLTRIIFMESRFNGMTYSEIAHKHNISTRMVTREIQSTLNSLRISLSDYLPTFVLVFTFLTNK